VETHPHQRIDDRGGMPNEMDEAGLVKPVVRLAEERGVGGIERRFVDEEPALRGGVHRAIDIGNRHVGLFPGLNAGVSLLERQASEGRDGGSHAGAHPAKPVFPKPFRPLPHRLERQQVQLGRREQLGMTVEHHAHKRRSRPGRRQHEARV
jgi:hypothetical protein